jgi:uncharacterized protein YgbK (DUF1537 family)
MTLAGPRSLSERMARYPPAADVDPAVPRGAVIRSGRRVVVLDDDPTGTQTVTDVPVVTRWGVDDLRWALAQPTTALFVLTNSRGRPAEQARQVTAEIMANLATAAADVQVGISVISRSDSTLRGHFPAETDIIAEAWPRVFDGRVDVTLLCPAYPEAGRVTIDDIHWVVSGDMLVPVSETEFARDPTFGYGHSDLKEWVAERSGGRWLAGQVGSIGLRDIRTGGPSQVARIVMAHDSGAPLVVNAADPADLDVVALGVVMAEEAGQTVLCRTGPSFTRARAGLPVRPPLSPGQLERAMDGNLAAHGLVVVGSHTQRTTEQMRRALDLGGLTEVELRVPALLDPGQSGAEVRAVTEAVVMGLESADVLLRTSRQLITGPSPEQSLEIAGSVARQLTAVVTAVVRRARPRWVIGKGGITSSDLVTRGLGLRRAWVLGQMLPGQVPAWGPASDGEAGGPLCVIFPGNVGEAGSLAEVILRLRAVSPARSGVMKPAFHDTGRY